MANADDVLRERLKSMKLTQDRFPCVACGGLELLLTDGMSLHTRPLCAYWTAHARSMWERNNKEDQ